MGVTLTSRFPHIAKELPSVVGMVIHKTAYDIEATAKELAPVDTGALRSSIYTRITGPESAEVDVGVEYGIYLEYGTYKMAAQPYLVPAFHTHLAPCMKAISQVISRL